MTQVRPLTQKQNHKSNNKNLENEKTSKRSTKQIYQWVAVYIDHKFYLTSAVSYQKLQKLEQQIVEEKNKLNSVSNKEKSQGQNRIPVDRQVVERQKKIRKNSIQSAMSRQCKTQINQLKALKARFQAEKQLAEEEMKYQNKTFEVRKRRQLKDATVFIIKDKIDRNDKSLDGQRSMKKKNDRNEKKFMMAPHEFASGKKSQEKSRVSSVAEHKDQKFLNNIQVYEGNKEKDKSQKYQTIQPKRMTKQQLTMNEGGNTVKMSQQSNQKRYFNSNASRSKEKSFVITSRRPPTSNSKQHRDSIINGLKEHKNKQQTVEASEQIQKLNKKLRQMQEKLSLVQKKQKLLQQMQKQKFQQREDEQKTKQIDIQKSQASSRLNNQLKSKHSQKIQKSIVFRSDTKSVKKQEIKQSVQQISTNQKSENRYIQKQLPQQNVAPQIQLPNKRKRLGITSLIVAYNHNQFLQKQKISQEETNIKQKMGQQIIELKKVIRQLKIQKIKQQVLIQDLTKKQQNQENSKTFDFQRNQLTFNGQASVARSIQSNSFPQRPNYFNKIESQRIQKQASQVNDQPLIKKQPRRYFKIETSMKKKFSIQTTSPVIEQKNKNTFTMNSAQIKNHISRASSYNPQQQNSRQNFMNLYQSRQLKKKGTIVKQIINKDKFKDSKVNSVEENQEQMQLEQNSYINSNVKSQQNNLVSNNSKEEKEVIKKQQYIRKLIQTQFTKKSEINIPQIQSIQEFPIPDLPKAPLSETPQAEVLERAKKVCQMFEIKLQGKDQLQFKKFKNCIILAAPGNGKAIVWHFSGKFYIGGWDEKNSLSQDHKTGQGFQYVPDKHYYRGQFLQGKRHGNGTMLMPNGNIYKGSWVRGQRQGKGIFYEKSSNSYYKGDWKDGKKHGRGIQKINDKQFYDGEFDKNMKSGLGIQLFSNGDIYEGCYKNGKFNGQGKYFWANGSIYSGNFIEGQRQGFGRWISSLIDGDIYEGDYKKDKKSGKGKYTWAKGCIYDGQFKSDLKHGQGSVQYPDGRKVNGLWQFGKLKQIEKSANVTKNQQQEPMEEIQPRIRPNFPVIVETPSKQMQSSKLFGRY